MHPPAVTQQFACSSTVEVMTYSSSPLVSEVDIVIPILQIWVKTTGKHPTPGNKPQSGQQNMNSEVSQSQHKETKLILRSLQHQYVLFQYMDDHIHLILYTFCSQRG